MSALLTLDLYSPWLSFIQLWKILENILRRGRCRWCTEVVTTPPTCPLTPTSRPGTSPPPATSRPTCSGWWRTPRCTWSTSGGSLTTRLSRRSTRTSLIPCPPPSPATSASTSTLRLNINRKHRITMRIYVYTILQISDLKTVWRDEAECGGQSTYHCNRDREERFPLRRG